MLNWMYHRPVLAVSALLLVIVALFVASHSTNQPPSATMAPTLELGR